MLDYTIQLARTEKIFNELSKTIQDLSSVFSQAIEYHKKFIIPDTFRTLGVVVEGRWKDLKPETWRRKKTKKMLIETGRMYNSAQGKNDYFQQISKQTARFGITLDYANYINFGTKKMPARPFFVTSNGKVPSRFYGYMIKLLDVELQKKINEARQ